MRVVLDTNVLIAALLFRKRLGWLTLAMDRGMLIPCFCVTTFQELNGVLRYPKFRKAFAAAGVTAEQVTEALAAQSIMVADPNVIPTAALDIPDNYILATGILADATYIVTGDKPLLSVQEFHGIPIITPRTLLQKIGTP